VSDAGAKSHTQGRWRARESDTLFEITFMDPKKRKSEQKNTNRPLSRSNQSMTIPGSTPAKPENKADQPHLHMEHAAQELQGERLARFLAHAGVASRRHAEELITAGRVQVNGNTITSQGVRIDPTTDRITVDGKVVRMETEHVYLLLHKPVGYLSTVSDPQGRPTVLDLLPEEIRKYRVYPVGRLDIDTSGLLLLTNDGDFALRLTHPRYEKTKRYEALVEGHPTQQALEALRTGVLIREDNGQYFQTSPADVALLQYNGDNSLIALNIKEGHKRQIRRMLAAVGLPVKHLQRVGIGSLGLHPLSVGQWCHLNMDEIRHLLPSAQ
jgi:23S rRNA pseudouridine2605 synthase